MAKSLIQNLKKWLKEEGNSYAKVAVLLGYADSAPVRQWMARKSIPTYQIERVKKIITGEIK